MPVAVYRRQWLRLKEEVNKYTEEKPDLNRLFMLLLPTINKQDFPPDSDIDPRD
jgi:hypothetical protein